jgi:hypothetical protein
MVEFSVKGFTGCFPGCQDTCTYMILYLDMFSNAEIAGYRSRTGFEAVSLSTALRKKLTDTGGIP